MIDHRLGFDIPKRYAFINMPQLMSDLTLAVGWISTLRVLGDIFEIRGFFILHSIMTIIMCLTWLVLFVLTAVAFYKGKIFISDEETVLKDTLERHGPSVCTNSEGATCDKV